MNKKFGVIFLCMLLLIIAIIPVSEALKKEIRNTQLMDDYFEIPTIVQIYGGKNEKQLISENEKFVINNQADVDIDFSFLDYGITEINIWKIIAGDYNMDTENNPTIKNNGAEPVYIKIMQNDMGFGKTGDEWNVEFGVRIGQENEVYFEPDEKIQLPKALEPGEAEKLDFYIRVKKGVAGNTYVGELELWAEDVPINNPPSPPFVSGKFNGHSNIPHGYFFTSEDPEYDEISYYIEWGDDTITDWTPLIPSGDSYYEAHIWEEGTFILKAYAKDSNGDVSSVSTKIITMTKGKHSSNIFLSNLFKYNQNSYQILRFLLTFFIK
jgi:hypothetical protein